MCALLVGLPEVTVISVGDWPGWLRVVLETPSERPSAAAVGLLIATGSARSNCTVSRSLRSAQESFALT